MIAKVGGNLDPGNQKAPTGPSKRAIQNAPTFWQVLSSRLLAVLFLLIVWLDLVSGRASMPSRYGHGTVFIRDQDPGMYWLCVATDVAIVFVAFFYSPYHRWNFTFKFPPLPPDPPPDESYAGYKRPPQIVVHPKLPPLRPSDFYEPAFIRSILILVCVFGAMVTAVGLYQLAIGEVYFPSGGALDVATFHDEPQQFITALMPYGVVGFLSLGLGVFLYFWRPVRQAP